MERPKHPAQRSPKYLLQNCYILGKTMIQDPAFYIFAVIAVIVVGISKSGFGSGLGMLGVPLIALVIPPIQAAAIMLPLLCIMDIFNMLHYRTRFDRTNIVILVPAGLLGI